MARKASKKNKLVDAEATGDKYDVVASQRALIKNGFHSAVTNKRPEEIEREWLARYVHIIDKPLKSEFKNQAPFRYLTTAPLLFRYESKYADSKKGAHNEDRTNSLARLLNAVDIGGKVANAIFAEGLGTVLNAAITSSASWLAMSNSVKIWDMNASAFRTNGNSGVLLVVTPECTVGEMKQAHDLDPYGLHPSNPLSLWCAEAMKLEKEIYFSIHLVQGSIKGKAGLRHNRKQETQNLKKMLPENLLAEEIVHAIRGIQDVNTIWGASQFVSGPHCRLFDPPAIFSVSRLKALLNQVLEQRKSFKVLYLQKIPYLDRRMVAVILRACPNVRMVGIYDCPLIHFGDVLCLIDLIYEVNCHRRNRGLPEVTGLDFYPHYNKGTPFASDATATYGLTWGPLKLDVAQRGFFNIIMKAFMKAKRMKLGLLFDHDKAFCKYLNQIPNYPLAVPTFLDAMYRYMEVKDAKARRKILYDLLKPVRLGLETNMAEDWPTYYSTIMGSHLVFCSSCGYETLQEFFTFFARQVPHPHRRRCAGCILQRWLDGEDDHLKAQKKQILDTLFPDWNGSEFNSDAPLPPSVRNILRLHSTESVRPEVNRILLNGKGEMYCPQIKEAFVRDNKDHLDSLKNLPSLRGLLKGPGSSARWGHVYNKCNNLDMYSRSTRKVQQDSIRSDGDKGVLGARLDGGMPDHIEELQPGKLAGHEILSRDFEAAAAFFIKLAHKGWSGYN
ncbi:hypothetical protein E4U42_000650 [Claviceps africana]|uniref:Uncharacterized protein n=1 Tax=Claviceps africana TaxID=83212 RepID=A0A8K0NKP2_9HYPO|nr:hypothetical protein E4U42_000650 [Claviceps africana]